MSTRNLLSKYSFLDSATSPWYTTSIGGAYDPWVQDTTTYPATNFTTGISSAFGAGPGLPVAYDPLWRWQTGVYFNVATSEARFASGLGFVRNDPNPSGSPLPSAHGLQRLTNFNPALP